jgi:hypothetical protein
MDEQNRNVQTRELGGSAVSLKSKMFHVVAVTAIHFLHGAKGSSMHGVPELRTRIP